MFMSIRKKRKGLRLVRLVRGLPVGSRSLSRGGCRQAQLPRLTWGLLMGLPMGLIVGLPMGNPELPLRAIMKTFLKVYRLRKY